MEHSSSEGGRRRSEIARGKIDDLIERLRADIPSLEDPQARALFEVSAEALGGLSKAFADYERRSEPAWRGS